MTHIGIILDGNRRYARRLGLKPWDGHQKGFDKLKDLFQWCKELDIKELTLYCFSMQNFKRDKLEVAFLMKIFEKAFNDVVDNEDIHKYKIKINPVGRIHLLPEKVQIALKKAVEATKDYDEYIINICIAYGGREEIVDAIKKIVEQGLKPDEIDIETVSKNIWLNSEPDFIIRTSGELRTSNFLIWQSYYSEWFFPTKTWPEFEKEDLIDCMDKFKNRSRRFGGG